MKLLTVSTKHHSAIKHFYIMKNNYSNIFTFNRKTLSKTINFLKNGNLVGLPTETVYGLGGNAYDKSSLKKIFIAHLLVSLCQDVCVLRGSLVRKWCF